MKAIDTQKLHLEKAHEINKALNLFVSGMLKATQNKEQQDSQVTELKGLTMSKDYYNGYKISKRKDGRWNSAITIYGNKKFIYGKTKEECYNNLKEFFKENKKEIKQKPLTINEYFNLWWKTYKEPTLAESTKISTKSYFNNHILPIIGNLTMNKATPLQINTLINKCKNRTKEYVSQYTAMLFRQAYKDKIINNNIADDFIKFTHKRKEGQALNIEQRKIFLKQCDNIKHGNIFKFYFYTGARPGEGLKFSYKDILENDLIRIPGTKTIGSNRIIPLFKPLKELFNKIKIDKKQKTLFGISEKTLDRQLKELNKLCGFHFATKDLRTTFGTMCAEMGIPDNIIAKWMGHTSEITTKKYYIKIQTQYEKEQINKFNNNF